MFILPRDVFSPPRDVRGLQAGDDAEGGIRLVPPWLVQGELVRHRFPQVSEDLWHIVHH